MPCVITVVTLILLDNIYTHDTKVSSSILLTISVEYSYLLILDFLVSLSGRSNILLSIIIHTKALINWKIMLLKIILYGVI